MNRGTAPSARPLSLTEELEKLEQSITLTLQEIDHNFSRAHRIVTSSILPIVEQYAEHSKAVWEGSKFWKQFFEASANVSLSGVEERDEEEEEEEDLSYTQSQDASTFATSISHPKDETLLDSGEHETYDQVDDSLLDNADISGSTPRAPPPRNASNGKPKFADYPSPYEALKEELKGVDGSQDEEDDTQIPPTTPGAQSRLPDMSMTPTSSPFDPTSYLPSTVLQSKPGDKPLLHRVLDKNYLLQATPHTTRKHNKTPANKPSWRDASSPMSSPPVAAPKLHAEIFSSPIRQQYTRPAARTPGVSVQTPAKGKSKQHIPASAKRDEISWESDSDEDAEGVYKELGMSPPKTIQFSLPQSRLLQTPAREASKRIVEDLLATAGAGMDDTDLSEGSPSVIMKDDVDYTF